MILNKKSVIEAMNHLPEEFPKFTLILL